MNINALLVELQSVTRAVEKIIDAHGIEDKTRIVSYHIDVPLPDLIHAAHVAGKNDNLVHVHYAICNADRHHYLYANFNGALTLSAVV